MQAQDTIISKFVARYIVPLSGPEKVLEMICEGTRGAARINALPMPKRPHSELWDDEREPRGFAWKHVICAISVGVAAFAAVAAQNGQLSVASLPKLMLGARVGSE